MASQTLMYRFIGSEKKFFPPKIEFFEDADCTVPIPIKVEMNNNTGVWQVKFTKNGFLRFDKLNENSRIDIFACGGGGGGASGRSLSCGSGHYVRAGGGGGGGGYCVNVSDTADNPIRNNTIYEIIIGEGGRGTNENSSSELNGGDGGTSFVKEHISGTIIAQANGGKGGTAMVTAVAYSSSNSTVRRIKTGGKGGAGGSGGGDAGAGKKAAGAGGRNGSNGAIGAVKGATIGGAGSGRVTIPFGEAIGDSYGSGGAGGSGTYEGSTLGGNTERAKGGLFNATMPGGGDGANTPTSGFTFNPDYHDITPSDPTKPSLVTSSGLTIYQASNTIVSWKDNIFSGKNGAANTGGGGGGGSYFYQGKSINFTKVPCIDKNNKQITSSISTKGYGHFYRGGDGGSGIVIIRGEAINKEEGE